MVASLVLKSSHKEAVKKSLLYEDNSDLTSPTSNHTPDIDIPVSVAYYTLKKKYAYAIRRVSGPGNPMIVRGFHPFTRYT